ncbi:MAG: alpha-2-macroglobulin family protein, partial [Gemmatimonadaceae bacterium]|nr:alpha-2-macroglobulin family protein [Chitinophagaceae bacterium]
MRIAKFLTTTMMVVIFLSACNRNAVLLDYTNAKDEVPQLGNLVFRFSQPLVHDSLMNQWDSTEYVSFEPKIPGRFRWESSSELVFSPLRPLSPATTYKASINDEVLRSTKFDKVEKGAGLSFKTPDLKLENSNITWVIDDQGSRQALPQLDLYFNYPVDPASLKSKLQVTIDGAAADYSVRTMSADNKMSLRLLNFKLADKDYQVDVVLGKGVVPEGGSNSTTETLSLKSFIPSPFTLTVNDVSAEHDGTTGTVTVKTSQQIVGEQLSNFVKISPAVKFTTETTEDGLLIRSEGFDVTKSYQLIFEKGLRGKIGGTLKEQYQGNVAFGKLEPSISFTNSRAIFLSGQGARNIEVKLISVPKVKVIVSKIYESNILSAQRHGYYPKEKGRSEEEYYYNDNNVGVDGDVIYEQEIETSTLARSGAGRLFNFNIADKLNDFKGIYHIKIRSTDDYWVSDSRFISVSDLGLIAREGTDKIFVFVNSIKTGQGVAGVNLNAYGANNQLIGTGTSNAEGVAEIKYAKNGFAGFNPAMIIARSETDFNFLPFNSTGVSTSRFDVGGKRVNQTGLDAFIYAERDIYRPGETVNFSVVVRDAAWKSPGEIPVKLRFLMPNGKELKTFRKNLNEQGSADGSVSIAASAITGSYSLELYNGNDVLLGNKNFMIEEFVPDRIKVTAKLDKAALSPGETATLNVNAVNFFGPPAANRNYETEIQVRQKSFVAKKYDRFDFSISNPGITFDKIVNEGKTDESGNITEKFVVKDEYKNVGMLQAVFYATVFDETGRPVSRNAQADIFTQQVFFGIGNDGWGYYPLNQSIKFPLAALNKGGQPTTATAKMEVIKHEYRTVLTKSGDYFRYESQREDKLVATSSVSITGDQGSYSFVPRSPGNYELRVSIPGSASFVKKEFYSYGGWSDNSSFEVNNEGNIDIELDRASYNSGETAKILFKTPFDGKMLVTFETDKVVSYQYVNVAKRSASVDIKLGVEHLPNVYVTATLIKPHEVSDIPLTVAHGYKSVRVEEKNRKMNVEIVASAAVRSKTHQKVSVKAAAGSYITLAAVDNGVLQVSDFKTPSPYDYFYAERALAVSAYDIYPLLFPEIRARLSSTGGDGELEMDKRVNPMPNKRIKIVSYWSGTKKADGSGNAAFEFDVPQFSGEIRLMAVAYKDESFGSAEANMKVADPLVLSTALPRFLSPGDTVSVPVTISNTTSKAASAVANISVQSPVQVIGDKSVTLQINANSEAVASFRVFAAPSVGAGKVSIQVQAAGEKFTEETDITVRPPSTLQKQTGSGTITNAGSTKVNIGTSDFMPGSDYHLVVSRSPVLELGNQFSYLIEYPYGCTEQTVSAAFPQLYYGDLADMFNSGKASKLSANDNIMEAIRKIKLRQLFNGAITLWDGEGTENWWVSAYAAHFLLEARKAGYNV